VRLPRVHILSRSHVAWCGLWECNSPSGALIKGAKKLYTLAVPQDAFDDVEEHLPFPLSRALEKNNEQAAAVSP